MFFLPLVFYLVFHGQFSVHIRRHSEIDCVCTSVHIHTHTRSSHTVLFHFSVGFPIRQARIGRESQHKKRNYTDSAVSSNFMFSLVHKLSRASRTTETLHNLSSLKSDLHKIVYLYTNQFLHLDISKKLLMQIRL